jgi:hypothetical protein
MHLASDEKSVQNEQEDIPDTLAFDLDGHVVRFVNKDQVPLENGDQCIVAGCLRKDAVDALVLKHLKTGRTASADTDQLRKLGRWIILISSLVIVVWLVAILTMYKVIWLSSPFFFIVGVLPIVVAGIAVWFGKEYFVDEAVLIEEALAKI